ncbi:MAG TPA: pyruvate dehydrogenase (acetyl-transferring) E1 component subunit alpha, partial [Candidatus Korarchaeota archaeon]|nr:pyruvate dehydrogenase (acetyl-transferring) E1 component subunit alpha [Candidatus Korarchaeota archaeon]
MAKLEVEVEEIGEVSVQEALSLGLTEVDLLQMYRKLVELRLFENRVEQLYLYEARIQGTAHLYTGEEAIAVGVARAIEGFGYIVSHHRGHGHALAMGIPPKEVMAELFGKKTGVVKGLGGS